MLPPTELTLSHHFRNCGTFNCDPVKQACGQRMGDATRARFRSPVDVAERLQTQNATVERNVRVPADVEERAPNPASLPHRFSNAPAIGTYHGAQRSSSSAPRERSARLCSTLHVTQALRRSGPAQPRTRPRLSIRRGGDRLPRR
jgi:hypothetical protein